MPIGDVNCWLVTISLPVTSPYWTFLVMSSTGYENAFAADRDITNEVLHKSNLHRNGKYSPSKS